MAGSDAMETAGMRKEIQGNDDQVVGEIPAFA
jgi:hypothetical protein